MKKQLIGLGVAALMFGGVGSASAAVITRTADGISGYDWLSFDVTAGMSRDSVEANQLGAGQDWFGYRYATRLETELLLDSYYESGTGDLHNDGVDVGYSVSTHDAAADFLSDFGALTTYTSSQSSTFFYGEYRLHSSGDGITYTGSVMEMWDPSGGFFNSQGGTDANASTTWSNFTNWGGSGVASLLVNDHQTTPTPEPATMLLFGTGLVGLVGSRIRKKKKQQ